MELALVIVAVAIWLDVRRKPRRSQRIADGQQADMTRSR